MMRGWSAARSPVVRRAVLFWLAVAFVVWNGVFDLLVERGGKEYLLAQALHELGRGPRVTLHHVMAHAIAQGVRIATMWAALVFLAGAGTTLVVRRATRREAASPWRGGGRAARTSAARVRGDEFLKSGAGGQPRWSIGTKRRRGGPM